MEGGDEKKTNGGENALEKKTSAVRCARDLKRVALLPSSLLERASESGSLVAFLLLFLLSVLGRLGF